MAKKSKKISYVPLIGISTIAAVVASLCCLAPIVLVLFGLSSISFAAALHIQLATTYKLALVAAGFATLFLGIRFYLSKKERWSESQFLTVYNYIILGIVLFVVAFLLIHNFLAFIGMNQFGIVEATKAIYIP